MNKESIVLFGLGKDFIRYRDKILNSYEVEFVTDNFLTQNKIGGKNESNIKYKIDQKQI